MRRLLVPGLTSLLMLVILIGLGVWQVQRLAWKEAILAQIDRAEAGPAVPLPPDAPPPFTKVEVTGTLDNAHAALYGAEVRDTPDGPQMGGQLIVPLLRPDAEPILVDRGWVPSAPLHPIEQPTGPVTIDGFIRAPEHPEVFTPADDPAHHVFYTLNPTPIGAALGLAKEAPFVLEALGRAVPGVFPEPATALPRPPNNHLQYAITWFGLAAILLVIFTLWSRKRLTVEADA
jgi:surfeit locus 1 family protein